jgi:hypothetical protein
VSFNTREGYAGGIEPVRVAVRITSAHNPKISIEEPENLLESSTMNAKHAWTALTAGVLAYEILCKDGELLSERVDQWLLSRPILTRAVIAALALHLGNAVPQRYDVVSLGFSVIRRGKVLLAVA